MSEKPEALRLAEELDAFNPFSGALLQPWLAAAATELRRLHAENEVLTAKIKAREDEILTHSEAVYEATKLLSEEREKNERLRSLLTEAREDVESLGPGLLLDRIDAALRREETT